MVIKILVTFFCPQVNNEENNDIINVYAIRMNTKENY
jgi:hypothetical protein